MNLHKKTNLSISVPLTCDMSYEHKLMEKVQKLKTNKSGFTLAETLITMTVIGVIAAMTVPTLITNYQKQSYVTALKKTNSELQNVFALMRNDQDLLWTINSHNGAMVNIGDAKWDNFYEVMSKYMKITRLPAEDPTCDKFYDGTSEFFCAKTNRGIEIHGTSSSNGLSVDINGPKGPNRHGRDIFRFQISDDNFNLIPTGSAQSLKHKYAGTNGIYWRDADSNSASACTAANVANNDKNYASTCTGRVLEEGKMNY